PVGCVTVKRPQIPGAGEEALPHWDQPATTKMGPFRRNLCPPDTGRNGIDGVSRLCPPGGHFPVTPFLTMRKGNRGDRPLPAALSSSATTSPYPAAVSLRPAPPSQAASSAFVIGS